MASNYPSSLDSYSTKASSDTITEGHINDPQDAIEALEAKVGIDASTPVDTTVLVGTGTGTSAWKVSTPIVQMVYTVTGTYNTGNTALPYDNTAPGPSVSEGDEMMTLAITPKHASNILKIDVVMFHSSDGAEHIIATLFQDGAGTCLAVGSGKCSSPDMVNTVFTYYMAAGTTSSTTFNVRAGCPSGNYNFNGSTSALMDGKFASSITITEIMV